MSKSDILKIGLCYFIALVAGFAAIINIGRPEFYNWMIISALWNIAGKLSFIMYNRKEQ